VKTTGRCAKVNWDAALDISNTNMDVGVVVIESCIVIAAMASVVPFIVDSIVAETMATWRAVPFYSDLGFQRVIFEGDA
jgi:hypothetical protein